MTGCNWRASFLFMAMTHFDSSLLADKTTNLVSVYDTSTYMWLSPFPTKEAHPFDLTGSGRWEKCASMESPRQSFAFGVKDGKIYVFRELAPNVCLSVPRICLCGNYKCYMQSRVISVLVDMLKMSFRGETNFSKLCVAAKEKDGVVSKEDTLKNPPTSSPAASGTVQDGILNFVCSSKGKLLVGDWIETFIGTTISVYLDKTKDIIVYEDIFSIVSNPTYKDSVKDLLTSVCNGALETLI